MLNDIKWDAAYTHTYTYISIYACYIVVLILWWLFHLHIDIMGHNDPSLASIARGGNGGRGAGLDYGDFAIATPQARHYNRSFCATVESTNANIL